MLSLASLLNPVPSGPFAPTPRCRYQEASSSLVNAPSLERPQAIYEQHIMTPKPSKMPKDMNGLVKSKVKGVVNFPPFEALDGPSLREIERYQIYPFGRIQEYCRHIPYNSGKKDFHDKTGRESFEVFQYIFNVPEDDNEYTVMWDYNVGLVRMTPFFKCCRYSKTQPAKMLNMNPGLRNITHSITGGSIVAQGYWMPFSCAKAVCATFCASIAGALIPIFGPDFPSMCISPDAPEHGRMTIAPSIIADAAHEAELFR
ncbi:transcription regulator HTH, apses-type DNA-binding domain-containing protein, partial [Coniella lustricola]